MKLPENVSMCIIDSQLGCIALNYKECKKPNNDNSNSELRIKLRGYLFRSHFDSLQIIKRKRAGSNDI